MIDKGLLVFNIQKYSLHDGSGIRTVVFLKGCPLRCKWCANPESHIGRRQVRYQRSKCLGKNKCGLCESCAGCISFDDENKAVVDFASVGENVEWVKVCPTKALFIEGRFLSIDEIIEAVEADAVFYRNGKGGLTVSGGEPLMQEGTIELLKRAKEDYIHTAIETCGYVKRERLLTAAGYLDEIFFDIKSLDEDKHISYTGVSNKPIVANLEALCEAYPGKPVTVRTPVIPGFNDSKEELFAIERFLENFENVKWEKLKYHKYGVPKYETLGLNYEL